MRLTILFILLLSLSCRPKQNDEPEQEDNNSEQTLTPAPQEQFDYTPLFGIYDHESTNNTFGAVLALSQNGLDLYFTASSVQGSCKAETEGVIIMVEHAENFYTGFANIEDCPLQFTFYPKENKVDIKEVTLCTIHGSTCSFEGVYVKRKVE